MPRIWTHKAAFAHFGTIPKNIFWSWSARSADGKQIAVTIWKNQLKKQDDHFFIEQGSYGLAEDSNGHRELKENLAWAWAHCDKRFHVVLADAENYDEHPRKITSCHPWERVVKRLTQFDPDTGSFTAVSEKS